MPERARTVTYGVRTNTGTHAAFRAPGYVEGMVGLEGALDELAQQARTWTRWQLRLKNYAEQGPAAATPGFHGQAPARVL